MIEDMRVRNLAPHTQATYILHVSLFVRHFCKSPELLGPEEIRDYQLYLTNQRRLAPSSIVVTTAALRFLYNVTLVPMPRAAAEVADVFRCYSEAYRQRHGASLSTAQRRVMTAIEQWRTAALGGHVEQCDTCGHQRISYNSCRNRHCPKCQSLARAQWLDDRRSELLAVPYFDVVFTVPQRVAAIAFHNKGPVYNILFHAAAETLRAIAAGSRTSRCGARLLRRPSYLGLDPAPSSTPALRRRRRRSFARRQPLDRLPAQLLSARARARTSLPPPVPDL
jgi:hypothetical protein